MSSQKYYYNRSYTHQRSNGEQYVWSKTHNMSDWRLTQRLTCLIRDQHSWYDTDMHYHGPTNLTGCQHTSITIYHGHTVEETLDNLIEDQNAWSSMSNGSWMRHVGPDWSLNRHVDLRWVSNQTCRCWMGFWLISDRSLIIIIYSWTHKTS